jgi:uroporphyrinogen decarboxylase
MTPRERVRSALAHREPDRVPADFLATPVVWDALAARLRVGPVAVPAEYVDPIREAVLDWLEVDLRVVSYDMFCNPPQTALDAGAVVDWWGSLDRSTPNRMWRQRLADGSSKDVWGIHRRAVRHGAGEYDELASCPLAAAESVEEVEGYPWPEPDWWDLDALPQLVSALDPFHLRYRIGSVFETAWQLRGLQELLVDLVAEPEIPRAIMSRITDVLVEVTRRVLDQVGDRIDLVYFYDDVAAQNSLLISPETWRTEVRPHHARLTQLALDRGVPVMYHCDGAVAPLIPSLIDLGVTVLNPIQPGASGMEPARLKADFGDRLTFHGGVDIVEKLPNGTPGEVADEVRRLVRVLGAGGGYILGSSHHIQPDTPIENVLAMYDVQLRYRAGQ